MTMHEGSAVKVPLLWPGVPMALLSAALFGASTPLAKLLLGDGISPWILAGLLYLGSGVGLGSVLLARTVGRMTAVEAPLRRGDLPRLALILLAGGMVAPLLLMIGLAHTEASVAALLLNLEGLATVAIAWLVFHENVDRRLLFGAFAILTGAVLVSWRGGPAGVGTGTFAIAGACLAWGLDNNLTRKLAAADPVQIAAVKGVVAGAASLGSAMVLGAGLPPGMTIAGAAGVGLFGYGMSLVLFLLALRHLGTARTGAYFSTAPFAGAALAIVLCHEPLTAQLVGAAVLMAAGVYLHLAERHEHEHAHEMIEHEHRHTHDEHHRQGHLPNDAGNGAHTHRHRHAPISHRHAHYPDLHHRHGHAQPE
jgi:drug/metabolite transporter (DMT)-like permease